MGIWTHSLKFNLGIGGIHHLPQTTGDGIHRKSCGILMITFRIRSSSYSIVRGFVRYTSSFAQPHRKKSQGVRSGLLAGHTWGPRRPSQRPGNFRSDQERTLSAKCGGAPLGPARYAGCGWTYLAPKPRSPQIGMLMDGHFSVRP
jgi:hypothetical protein